MTAQIFTNQSFSPIWTLQILLEVGMKHKAYWCVRNLDSPLSWRTLEIYVLLVILIIPAAVMCFR